MTVLEIYDRYLIPANLRRHMLLVGGVSRIIVDHFDGGLDGEVLVKTMLLHDMGNIIKFKFDNLDLLDDEDKLRVNDLKAMKMRFIEKYGDDCDVATEIIIGELTGDDRLVGLCANSHGEQAHLFLGTNEWEKKASYYSDMRVGPFGVLSVNERFDDLEDRYGNNKGKIEQLKRFRAECLEIEEQLQSKTSLDLMRIDDELVAGVVDELKNIEFSIPQDKRVG